MKGKYQPDFSTNLYKTRDEVKRINMVPPQEIKAHECVQILLLDLLPALQAQHIQNRIETFLIPLLPKPCFPPFNQPVPNIPHLPGGTEPKSALTLPLPISPNPDIKGSPFHLSTDCICLFLIYYSNLIDNSISTLSPFI